MRVTRSTEWMREKWDSLKAMEADEDPSDVAQWRLVRVTVGVQDGQKVHIALFWPAKHVEAYALASGEPVLLRLPKDNLSGEGEITSIEAAPFIPSGDEPLGRMFISGKGGGPGKGTIETMEVGDYVTTYTHQERGDRLPVDNTQGKWVARQRVRLRLDKEDGGHSKIVFLRDTVWLRTEKAVVGGTVYLDMPDMGCVGHARVEAIEPCMVFFRWGNSSIRMVTGTFAHSEGWCGELKLKGESKPLGVTAAHPFWSVDRQDWVPVGELLSGETVKTVQGTTTVESYTMCDKPEPVFNMEVEGDHVYRVGDQGILVHNSSDSCHICDNIVESNTPVELKGKGGTYQARIDRGERTPGSGKLYCRIRSIQGKIARFKSDQDSSDSKRERSWINDNFLKLLPSTNKYQAGHLIADRLGGPNDRQQMVAMYADFNKSKELWAGMETWIFGCLAGEARPGVPSPNPCPAAYPEGFMQVSVKYDDNAMGAMKAFPTEIKVDVTFFSSGLAQGATPTAPSKTQTFKFTQGGGSGTRDPKSVPAQC